MVTRVMVALNIQSIDSSSIVVATRKDKGLIHLDDLRRVYLDWTRKERNHSNSVKSRVSSKSRWRSSVEKVIVVPEKDKIFEQVESGLNYLIEG